MTDVIDIDAADLQVAELADVQPVDDRPARVIPWRQVVFAGVLAVAGALIAVGFAQAWEPLGFIVAGILLAVWSWLILADGGAA